MSLPSRSQPGAGFLVLVASCALCFVFFAWGFARPPLDELWQLQFELEVGERDSLSPREFALMQRALLRHPEIAESMLGGADSGLISAHDRGLVESGWAYFVRCKPGPARLELQRAGQGAPGGDSTIRVRVADGERAAALDASGRLLLPLAEAAGYPQLIEVRLGAEPKAKRRRSTFAVGLREGP